VGGESLFGQADGRRGVGLGGEGLDEECQPLGGPRGQVESDREPGRRFP
jgi:hypothetical protein